MLSCCRQCSRSSPTATVMPSPSGDTERPAERPAAVPVPVLSCRRVGRGGQEQMRDQEQDFREEHCACALAECAAMAVRRRKGGAWCTGCGSRSRGWD